MWQVLIFRGWTGRVLPARQRTTEHLLSVARYHPIRYIIKSCPVTGGGRNAISEWTTITSRVIEPGQREPTCKSNIGCCDTYAHSVLHPFIASPCGRASAELSWTIRIRKSSKILIPPERNRYSRVSCFLRIVAV